MKEYNIVGRHKDNFNFNPEIIYTCVDDEKDYLLNEYRISFGNDWDLWLEEIKTKKGNINVRFKNNKNNK